MSKPYLVAAPTSFPLNKNDVKRHMRIDHAVDDSYIDSLIAACTSYLDGRTGILGRALITQTWGRKISYFPSMLRLPLGPVASIGVVTYYNPSDAQTTLPNTVYELREDDIGQYMALQWGQQWPNYNPRTNGIIVTWVAGTAASAIPPAIKHAMLFIVGHWYENRELAAIGVPPAGELPFAASALLAPFRLMTPYYTEEEGIYSPWP